MNLKGKVCIYCGCCFVPSGPAAKFCSECKLHIVSLEKQVVADERRIRKFKTCEMIGRGNTQGIGESHHSYKSGIGCFFTKVRRELKDKLRFCQSCGKDLLNVSRYKWCCHHIDHDRANNTIDNLTLLCKSCHQIEHECWKNFLEGAETIESSKE